VTRSFMFAAALALAIPGAAFAQASGGSGADVRANPTPTTAAKTMPKMGHMGMSRVRSAPSADRSADDLNAKELTSIQASRGGPPAPSKP
jgi:hypothetical protein